MANARQELKDLAKAIDILTEFRESDKAGESELVIGVLKDAELDWRVKYMDLQKTTVGKQPKKRQ